MGKGLSDKERFILLLLFSGLILIYYKFDLFLLKIPFIIKFLPILAINIYLFIKSDMYISIKGNMKKVCVFIKSHLNRTNVAFIHPVYYRLQRR